TRAEKVHAIGANPFARREQDLNLMDGRLRLEIKGANRAVLSGSRSVNTDRLIRAPRPYLIQIGPMPQRQIIIRRFLVAEALIKPTADPAAADPDRIAFKTQPIFPGHWRMELAPTVAAGITENAGNPPDGFALARFRTRHRRPARADIRLRMRIQHREGQPVRQRPVLARAE